MKSYIFDLDYTLYSENDVNDKGSSNQFYNSFKKNPLLSKLLKQIRGKKFIFTNGNKVHLDDVLKKMKLKSVFYNTANSDEFNLHMKPDIYSYLYVDNKFKLDKYNEIFFFEDSIENLKTAKKLGWKTILIDFKNEYSKNYTYVDFKFSTIEKALIFFYKNQ
jgi:HAD superfamily hydrolase (TIGR01509 family)|uniref:Pyrimidine 5'-nucleotidase n=1 Tax=viral metagenome TaxID=1070528 RepID=A0A6C0LZH4_9ZZZZ